MCWYTVLPSRSETNAVISNITIQPQMTITPEARLLLTCICIQIHHVIFGRGNQEEPSFNDCSLTYCVFLRNSLILRTVIVGGTQGCQSMERP